MTEIEKDVKLNKYTCEDCLNSCKCSECGVGKKVKKKGTKRPANEWQKFVSAERKGKKFKNCAESAEHLRGLKARYAEIKEKLQKDKEAVSELEITCES